MGFLGGIFLAVALQAGPVEKEQKPVAVAAPVFNPSACAKKRVDPCGCHHVYGIRHCHPNRKGDHCEAPVKAEVEAPRKRQDASKKADTQARTREPEKKQLDPSKSVSM
ncbi:hypothetical protein HV824_12320 [Myxococcus sp. AM009]|uniref:hypothetical protein n=1 Tax=unclassified Myxococcus TaxID=2648731 RepID=UPI0015960DE4|nr:MULTISPECIES: hypothetical protein [unclassified Myxococcus]NVI98898.1 hypothetical protein [Myxococcus sp. AM009]NVJ17275.1 hypothetical protein [Myxococcus sp. AM010]